MATLRKVDFSRAMYYNHLFKQGDDVKICNRCFIEKPFDEFVKHKRYPDGIYCFCKSCVREKNKEYKPTELAKQKKLESRTKYRENNREKIREQDRNNYKNNPEKFREKARKNVLEYLDRTGFEKRSERNESFPEIEKARMLVHSSVRNGTLVKPNICQDCNKTSDRIEGHHEDYSKPLEVVWLCVPCHRKIHRKGNHRNRLSGKNPKGYATVKPHAKV